VSIAQRINLEIRGLSIRSPRQEMAILIGNRMRKRGSFGVEKKNRLTIGTTQFNRHEFSDWSWKDIEQSAIRRNGKWDFIGRLKFIGEFDQSRRIEAINIKRSLKRKFFSRFTGSDQKK
jgi:hypothetical protein